MLDYHTAVSKLFERHRSVRDAGFTGDAYKPGLEAMESYSTFLGRPERDLRCLHVAGTNGKGSVCSMLAAALASDGRSRIGLYTSPHLLDFRERIKVIGSSAEMIPEEAVCEFLEHYDRDGLTFFEVTTGMAFWWYVRSKVDFAVIETGLGGRLDSTNIVTPLISIITSIGLDHCDLLGSTRAEIAAEKAGIFKPGVPALVWGRDPETQPVFERIAAEVGAPLHYAEDYPLPAAAKGLGLDLPGPCQDLNLRTALAALTILGIYGADAGSDAAILGAIAHTGAITELRGRFERLLDNPLTFCDIGHNPPAVAATFDRLRELRENRRPLIVVYGAMKDKDVDTIKDYFPEDAEYFLVQPETPRAMPLADLASKLKHLPAVSAVGTESRSSVEEGVRLALERARELPGAIVYIGGSTFVVSEAITYIESL